MKGFLDDLATFTPKELRKELRRMRAVLTALFAVFFLTSLWPQPSHRSILNAAVAAFVCLWNFVAWLAVRRRLTITIPDDEIKSVTIRGQTFTYPRDGVHDGGPDA